MEAARELVAVSAGTVEMARTATATLEALAREQHTLAIWLCREYGGLSFEDAEDLVAEAFSRINGDLPTNLPAARAYVRKMLQRDAIDELRHRHGRRPSERAQRPKLVALGELPEREQPAGPQTADGELARRAARSLSQAAVQRALAALPADERETVRMRYLDGLEPSTICRGLGLSRTQYERRLTDGIRHALEALVAEAPLPACTGVRASIAASPGRLLDADGAARRDAHIEECLSCRAFERRVRGLLALTPTGPALGWWVQLRLKGEGWLHRGAEVASGAPGDATAVATAGSAGAAGGLSAGGLLAGGAAVKVAAVCSSAAVAVVCVAQVGPTLERPAHKSDVAVVAKHASKRPRPAVVSTTVAATPTPTASASVTSQPTSARPGANRTMSGSRRAASARKRAASAEFVPEGATSGTEAPATAAAASASSPAPNTATSNEGLPDRPRPASGSAGSEFEP